MNELAMKSDKKLPNLKIPVKGKKGTSKYMRMNVKTTNAPYTSDYKKAMAASYDPSGTTETIVDPRDLRGRPKKPDPNPESKYGIKHPLHPANLAKKKKVKESVNEKKVGGYDIDKHISIRRGNKYHKTVDNIFIKKSDAEAFAKKYDGFIIPQARGRFLVGLNKVTEGAFWGQDKMAKQYKDDIKKRGKVQVSKMVDKARHTITVDKKDVDKHKKKGWDLHPDFKESIDNHPKVKAARKAHAAGTWDGNVDKEGEAVVHINGKPHTVTNRYGKKKNEAMSNEASMDLKRAEKFMGPSKNFNQAVNLVSKGMKVSKQQAIKIVKKILGVNPKTNKIDEAIKHTHAVVDPAGKVAGMTSNERDAKDIARRHKGRVIKLKKPMSPNKGDMMINRPFKEEVEVDEALTLTQRMKRSRLMKRLKSRIKVGRDRAKRKMAGKDKLLKRAARQARNMIAKKLTRGIPKRELSFARKQEIEKRLEKPTMKQRIKRIAKRLFKDVRKKEVERKKG